MYTNSAIVVFGALRVNQHLPVKFSVLFVNVYSCQQFPSSVENLTTLGFGSDLDTAASNPPWSPIW